MATVDQYTAVIKAALQQRGTQIAESYIRQGRDQNVQQKRLAYCTQMFNPGNGQIEQGLLNVILVQLLVRIAKHHQAGTAGQITESSIVDTTVSVASQVLPLHYMYYIWTQDQGSLAHLPDTDATKATVRQHANEWHQSLQSVQSLYAQAVQAINQTNNQLGGIQQQSGMNSLSSMTVGQGIGQGNAPVNALAAALSDTVPQVAAQVNAGLSPELPKPEPVAVTPDSYIPVIDGPDFSKERPWDVYKMGDKIYRHVSVNPKLPSRQLNEPGSICPVYNFFTHALYVVYEEKKPPRYELVELTRTMKYLTLSALAQLGGLGSREMPTTFKRDKQDPTSEAALKWMANRKAIITEKSIKTMELQRVALEGYSASLADFLQEACRVTLLSDNVVVSGVVRHRFVTSAQGDLPATRFVDTILEQTSLLAMIKYCQEHRSKIHVGLFKYIEQSILTAINAVNEVLISPGTLLGSFNGIDSMSTFVTNHFDPATRNQYYSDIIQRVNCALTRVDFDDMRQDILSRFDAPSKEALVVVETRLRDTVMFDTGIAVICLNADLVDLGLAITSSYAKLPSDNSFNEIVQQFAATPADEYYVVLRDGRMLQILHDFEATKNVFVRAVAA